MGDIVARLRDLPRLRLAHLPTPLEPMARLGEVLGLKSLWVKRDDCTGLGFGGNKVRKLEFSLAAAKTTGADCVICGGVVQSNTARQVASACAKLGIECHLGIMHGRLRSTEPGYAATGNILLGRLYGATVHDVPWDEDRNRGLRDLAAELTQKGRRAFLIPYGASDALGAMGYAVAAEEIIHQCPDAAWIVHGSGSAGTQAGLLAGLLALGHRARVIGVDVDAQSDRVASDVRHIAHEAATMLGVGERWQNALTEEAICLAARLEGLALDPVYSGKSMAGLIGLARRGRFRDDEPVVWVHTGGSPGLFAYPVTMARAAASNARDNVRPRPSPTSTASSR